MTCRLAICRVRLAMWGGMLASCIKTACWLSCCWWKNCISLLLLASWFGIWFLAAPETLVVVEGKWEVCWVAMVTGVLWRVPAAGVRLREAVTGTVILVREVEGDIISVVLLEHWGDSWVPFSLMAIKANKSPIEIESLKNLSQAKVLKILHLLMKLILVRYARNYGSITKVVYKCTYSDCAIHITFHS